MRIMIPCFRRGWLGPLIGLLCATSQAAEPVESRIEQARQFRATETGSGSGSSGTVLATGAEGTAGAENESFGSQQILRRQEKLHPFNAFAEVSAFYTNNVALSHRNGVGDAFLVPTFGLSYQRPITDALRAEFTLKGGVYRYNKFTELDFESVDAGGGLTYQLHSLGNVEVFARYNFTELISADSGDEFFQGHTLTFGVQKAIAFSRAHGIYAGVAATLNKADPAAAERNEYGIFAGYHLQATRHLSSDLLYRLNFQHYWDTSRQDLNNALSLTLRYDVADWLNVSASTYFSTNASNDSAFSYDVFNAGGGLGANIRF
ncbi:MAG: hypothetical protein QOD99_1444 [Chthoniobacter sp.]|jgi:hypothetical protein|nr:hypothetical protein [Chthoniobacter sp.]